MKKLIIATALLSATAMCYAQETSGTQDKRDKVRFGLKAGANMANVIRMDDSDFSSGHKLGFTGGVFVDLPLATVFSIQPEVLFTQKGYKSEGTFATAPYKYKQTTNFIEVPILAKIKPSKSFSILAGPQFSFLTSTKTSFETANTEYEQIVDAENDNLRKNIFGGVIGVEANADKFLAGLRYNLDFQRNNGDGTSTTLRYKNQVIALYVGVIF